jgi:TRAP transporter TAXI family solute receptor
MSAAFGGFTYIFGAGLAECINKNSTWLTATNQEVPGGMVNITKDYDNPAIKAVTLRMVSSTVFWSAIQGIAPFEQKYNPKAVMTFTVPLNVFITTDPKIQTISDFVGKKVMVGGRGSSVAMDTQFMLDSCYGVWDKIDKQFLAFTAAKDSFMDGLIPVIAGAASWDSGSSYSLQPNIIEIIRMKNDARLIGMSPESIATGVKKTGWPVPTMKIPAKSFSPTLPPTDLTTFGGQLVWAAYPEMPSDVVYEITRIVNENRDYFVKLNASFKLLSSPDVMGFLPAANESEVHPGALQYYKDHNIKISIGGVSPIK